MDTRLKVKRRGQSCHRIDIIELVRIVIIKDLFSNRPNRGREQFSPDQNIVALIGDPPMSVWRFFVRRGLY